MYTYKGDVGSVCYNPCCIRGVELQHLCLYIALDLQAATGQVNGLSLLITRVSEFAKTI